MNQASNMNQASMNRASVNIVLQKALFGKPKNERSFFNGRIKGI